jgi:cytochrome c553
VSAASRRLAAIAGITATAAFFFGAAHAQPAPPKAQTCVACHGPEGNSANPALPSLAGQPRQFIATQLVMFREGNRKDAQMSPFALGLSNAEVNELSAYFSAQKLASPAHAASADAATAGKRLTEQYNCNVCHGATLLGQQHIPRLAGQQGEYLRMQLRGFKASTRFDMDGQMTSAAQGLTAGDIDLLADYLASLAGP